METLLTIQQASVFASKHLNRNVTSSNISYLIQYGKIRKFNENGNTQIAKQDLVKYYSAYQPARKAAWKKWLGNDLNWALSFEYLSGKDTQRSTYITYIHTKANLYRNLFSILKHYFEK